MRIQETGRILKDSRDSRRAGHRAEQEGEGMFARAWKRIASLPERLTSRLRHH
jgi:hypothetical protein